MTVRFGGNVALDDVSFAAERRSGHRAHRPERRRQDDAVQRHRWPAAGRAPVGSCSVAATSPACPPTSGPAPGWPARSSASSSSACSPPTATCGSPPTSPAGGAPIRAQRRRRRRRAARARRAQRGRRRARRPAPDRARPGSSSWPAPSPPRRRCCSSTSRRRASTRPRRRRSACWCASWRPRAWPCVLVEHDVPLVMAVCDEIHVLDVGRVLAIGTADGDPGRRAGPRRLPRGGDGVSAVVAVVDARRSSSSAASGPATGASRCCTASTSSCPAGRSPRCSVRTAPARRPRCG